MIRNGRSSRLIAWKMEMKLNADMEMETTGDVNTQVRLVELIGYN